MKINDLITIVVPVYNVEKYLCECINSLINQSYKYYEIILVDDGSTDNSGKICDNYASKYSNIKVIHKVNEGLGLTRNVGIEYAQGKYVIFFDSDDYADKDLLYNLIYTIKESNADACIGGFKKINDQKKVLFTEKYDKTVFYHDGKINEILIRMFGSLPNKHDSIRMSVWNVLYKVSIIKNNKLLFQSEREFISEDLLFNYKYYKLAETVVILDTSYYNYRFNSSSLTTSYKDNRFDMTVKFFRYLENQILNDQLKSECILRIYKLFFVYIRSCIYQEKKSISKKKIKDSIKKIYAICNNDYVKKIILNYPIKKLPLKQRVFVYLIKFRLSVLLYIFS